MTDRIDAALERLARLHPKLIDLGLARSFALLEKMGNPQNHLPPTIHLAGTNGKGSTAAFLAAMAAAAGLRVHSYTSPHLCRFNERIRLAGQLISDAGLADLLDETEALNGSAEITFFEVTTAAAMLAFSRHPADLLILETGLGGRLDSTNVLAQPAVCVLTPVARDHEHFLGRDLAEIAAAKAGIMRARVPCISARQPEQAEAVFIAEAGRLDTPLLIAGRDWHFDRLADGGIGLDFGGKTWCLPRPSLAGAHQQDNAALAAAALKMAMPTIDFPAATDGIRQAVWPGRVQDLSAGKLAGLLNNQPLWLDGAHNAHGAAALASALADIVLPAGTDDKWVLIYGALNTRPPAEFLAPLAPLASQVITLEIPGEQAALPAAELANSARSLGLAATEAANLEAALRLARGTAPVIICGSLYLAGKVLQANETLPD